MGWRYRKRIKILPDIFINISKSGISTNVGVKGANVTFGPKGTYVNTGLPGSGLYRRDKVSESDSGVKDNDALMDSPYMNQQYKTSLQDSNENEHSIWGFFKRLFSKSDIPNTESRQNDCKEEEQKTSEDIVDNKQEVSLASVFNEKSKNNQESTITNNNFVEETLSVSDDENYSVPQEAYSEPYNPKGDLIHYRYPILDLLRKDDFEEIDIEEQTANKNRIIELLRSFSIKISSIMATTGPRITLYEITLAPGFSMSRLKGLEDDIALALCSHDVKIMALLDKGTIGIEVPNAKLKVVSVENVFGSRYFQESFMALPCAIGKTMANDLFMFDLTKAPHILIGGSTGQGKSVTINAIITSLLYKKHPAELKLVLMDSSGLELSPYSKIANHFLASASDGLQIVTNSSQAVTTLKSLCEEMHARYELLRDATARDIKEYNEKFVNHRLNPANGHKYMPYIVVVIDEYGNFIEERGAEIEQSITQLAQDARAVGIHLIISTNRPTNNVITGAIKANFPTRISFRVPERIDSQVILDCNGAENLLGNGDMLYRAGKGIDCIRIQGAYVDTLEVDRIVNFISDQQGYRYQFELPNSHYNKKQLNSQDIDIKSYDPLLSEAAHAIVITQQGSCSMIQRRFSIGYNRAGQLMEQLEKIGVVGAERGSRPRDVLIADIDSLNSLLSNKIY